MTLAAAMQTIGPSWDGFEKIVREHTRRLAAATDAACLRMLYGNRGSHLGVLVELKGLAFTVSLLDPDDDDRVTPGEITTIRSEPTIWRWSREPIR